MKVTEGLTCMCLFAVSDPPAPLRVYVFVLPWGESEGLSHGARLIGWIHLDLHQNPEHGPGPNPPAASMRHDATDSNLTHSSPASFFFHPFSSWCLNRSTSLESDTRFTSCQRHSSSSSLHLSRGLFFKRMPFVVRAGGQGVREEEESLTLLYLHRFQFIRSKHFQDQKALILSVWTGGNNEGRVRDHSVPLLALISSYHAAKIGACLNISGSQKYSEAAMIWRHRLTNEFHSTRSLKIKNKN